MLSSKSICSLSLTYQSNLVHATTRFCTTFPPPLQSLVTLLQLHSTSTPSRSLDLDGRSFNSPSVGLWSELLVGTLKRSMRQPWLWGGASVISEDGEPWLSVQNCRLQHWYKYTKYFTRDVAPPQHQPQHSTHFLHFLHSKEMLPVRASHDWLQFKVLFSTYARLLLRCVRHPTNAWFLPMGRSVAYNFGVCGQIFIIFLA